MVQKIQFEILQNQLKDSHLYVLLAPHLANQGYNNTGWSGDYKGIPMLFARHKNWRALALACSVPIKACSCGYVGENDGWQDLKAHKERKQILKR